MSVTAYATTTELQQIWSSFGVTVRVDDDFDGSADSGLLTAVLEQATTEVNRYLLARYTVAVCAASAWVKWATAVLACVLLARRRGNPVPEAIAEEAAEYRKTLEAIRTGNESLIADAELADPRFDSTAVVENYAVSGYYRRAKIRRLGQTSTGGSQGEGRKQFNANDYGAVL